MGLKIMCDEGCGTLTSSVTTSRAFKLEGSQVTWVLNEMIHATNQARRELAYTALKDEFRGNGEVKNGHTVSDNFVHSELIEIEYLPRDDPLKEVGLNLPRSSKQLTYEYEDYNIRDADSTCQVLYETAQRQLLNRVRTL